MSLLLYACLSACLFVGASNDISTALHETLQGRANAADIQQALNETLGLQAVSPSGIRVTGRQVSVRELDKEIWAEELAPEAAVWSAIAVDGHGPEPLQVLAPLPGPGDPGRPEGFCEWAGYLRTGAGLFLKLDSETTADGGHVAFECPASGDYLIAAEPPRADDPLEKAAFMPSSPPPSRDPALKEKWGLFPVAPDVVSGPVPLILVHGAATDRWAEFIHWATFSPEAGEFRANYQVWNFRHEMAGINAPMGFDPGCPVFEESIAAHLARFLHGAETEGVEEDGVRCWFPPGPFSMMAHSSGALKARAFLVNFPDYAARVTACVTLGSTHLGTPIATMEWNRHTISRLGIGRLNLLDRVMELLVAINYFSISNQSDLDAGWLNNDREGGKGIPFRRFMTWTRADGYHRRVLSPRDANRTDARTLPGFEEDVTFEPKEPLDTFCGGLDLITPAERGGLHTDKLFLYASYYGRDFDLFGTLRRSGDGLMPGWLNLAENIGLWTVALLVNLFESPGGRYPLGVHALGDGFVPLQSQLFMDGRETAPLYKTRSRFGWTVPDFPLRPDMDLIREHTLANPDRIRLFPGWSHLETVTGRYNKTTGHSELFSMVAEDLLGVL